MKTTLKKTMAALSAAAVVATCAAVMAVPASAAGAVISVGTVTLTESELKAANYQVTLPLSVTNNPGFNSLGFMIGIPTGTSVGTTQDEVLENVVANSGLAAPALNDAGTALWFGMTKSSNIKGDGAFGSMLVTVDTSAKAGDTYTFTASDKKANGDAGTFTNFNGDTLEWSVASGAIIIVADETEAPATTTTTAPVATATEKTTTTTTAAKVATKTTSTSSPKTGDALPVAGVAVAVAVIGGVALVSKKRK